MELTEKEEIQVQRYFELIADMKQIETILKNHNYNYSKIYQKVNRGMIRVQYDLRKNINDLDERERGMLIATRALLNSYHIEAFVEITLPDGSVRLIFGNDYTEMKKKKFLIWNDLFLKGLLRQSLFFCLLDNIPGLL